MATEADRKQERYLYDKYQLCKALMAEKEATIKRLEVELVVLERRKERLGKNWIRKLNEINYGDLNARSSIGNSY